MIAGSALRRGLVMVTSNASEFERIRGLILQDWRNGVAVPRDI
jgi:predicted nucleic acid-binding protein